MVMSVEIGIAISFVLCVVGVVTFIDSKSGKLKNEGNREAIRDAKIDFVSQNVTEIKVDLKEFQKSLGGYSDRLLSLEHRVGANEDRLDTLEFQQRIGGGEKPS